MKKILITGGCGFIGAAVSNELLKNENLSIRIIDNQSVGTSADLQSVVEKKIVLNKRGQVSSEWNKSIEVFEADIREFERCCALTKGADAIVHLAANTGVAPSVEDPLLDCHQNVIGTLNLLECARLNGIPKFIFASSGAPLGEQEPPLTEKSVPRPSSPYGASKLAGEAYCSAYFRSFGVETVALRFSNVYGPGSQNKSSAVAKFIKLALQGYNIEVFGDGNQTRDFIFISDLVNAILQSLNMTDVGGEIFQIATAKETSVRELLKTLELCLKKRDFNFPNIIFSEQRVGDVRRNFSDTSKARSLLNWSAKVQLENGLDETITYFVERNKNA